MRVAKGNECRTTACKSLGFTTRCATRGALVYLWLWMEFGAETHGVTNNTLNGQVARRRQQRKIQLPTKEQPRFLLESRLDASCGAALLSCVVDRDGSSNSAGGYLTAFTTILSIAKLQDDDNSKRYSCPKEAPQFLVENHDSMHHVAPPCYRWLWIEFGAEIRYVDA
jgi:hypothetical protein